MHEETGSLEVGKMADLALWDGHPFSIYSKTLAVFIDGHVVFERKLGPRVSDFEVGLFAGGAK